jgi:hypothetical protein
MSMRRTAVLAATFLLSGCYSYRSVTGRVYGPDLVASDAALLDSGSASLHCARSQIHERYVAASRAGGNLLVLPGVTGFALAVQDGGATGNGMFIAEGCGQRAVYVADCRRRAQQVCAGGGIGSLPDSCADETLDATCELILVSKVALE